MNFIIAIVILGITITIHELGHFLSAKALGIRVLEFAVGFGPAILKSKKTKTQYSLRILPLGGYCSFDDPTQVGEDEKAFTNAAIWKQILVLLAGPVMNLVFGFLVAVVMVATGGTFASLTVSDFAENASSQASGLQVNDEIKKVNGMNIFVDSDIVFQLLSDEDGIVSMEVERNGERISLDEVRFKTALSEQTGKQQILIDFKVYPEKPTIANILPRSFKETLSTARLVWVSLIGLINGTYGMNELSGPVGVVEAVGNAVSYGLGPVLNLVVLISINLGIFNILPLPALDGGRIIFRLIEGATGKKIKPEVEAVIHFVGIALFFVLAIFITFNDITKLFNR